jgi:hypothetical protein
MTVRVTATTRDAVMTASRSSSRSARRPSSSPTGSPSSGRRPTATDSVTFYVLSGEIGDIPITHESGYFANSVAVPLTLTCKPFGYGSTRRQRRDGERRDAAHHRRPSPNVAGDVPPKARSSSPTCDAGTPRRHLGSRAALLQPGSPAPVLIAAGSLVTTGFAGTAGRSPARTSATSSARPSRTADRGVRDRQPAAHRHLPGPRPRAGRPRTPSAFRLAWQDGDGPFTANPWVTPPAAATAGANRPRRDHHRPRARHATLDRPHRGTPLDGTSADRVRQPPRADPRRRRVRPRQGRVRLPAGVVVARDDFTGTRPPPRRAERAHRPARRRVGDQRRRDRLRGVADRASNPTSRRSARPSSSGTTAEVGRPLRASSAQR